MKPFPSADSLFRATRRQSYTQRDQILESLKMASMQGSYWTKIPFRVHSSLVKELRDLGYWVTTHKAPNSNIKETQIAW